MFPYLPFTIETVMQQADGAEVCGLVIADDLNDAVSESEKFALYDSLNAVYQFAYRLSELTQRHLVLERSRTWKLAE